MEGIIAHDYSDGNRAFLQAILARGTITYEQSRPILAAIYNVDDPRGDETRPEQITEEIFRQYLDRASEVASFFDYEIRSSLHQVSRERIYAIVNTTSDPQTQLATRYAADELSFIKRMLDAIFSTYNTPRMEVLAITEMQVYKLARPPRRQSSTQTQVDGEEQAQQTDKGLKHSEVETVLFSLVGSGWMEKSKSKFYSMSTRALLELRPWLTETFNDPDAPAEEWQRVKFCGACKDMVTYGLRCAEPECTLRLHDGCQDAFWRVQRSHNCPVCSKEWTGKSFVGERAVTQTDAYRRGRNKSSGRPSNLADDVIRQATRGEVDEDQEDSDE